MPRTFADRGRAPPGHGIVVLDKVPMRVLPGDMKTFDGQGYARSADASRGEARVS